MTPTRSEIEALVMQIQEEFLREAIRRPTDDVIVIPDAPAEPSTVASGQPVIGRTPAPPSAPWAPRAAVPQLHVRRVRARTEQPVRARGGHGRRRGAAVARRTTRCSSTAASAWARRTCCSPIGHHMYRLKPSLRVKYVTSEQFVTEFIKAVRERQGDSFRAEVPRGRRPAGRRHPVPGQARGDADRVLPHVQPPAQRRPADRDRVRPAAARDLRAWRSG